MSAQGPSTNGPAIGATATASLKAVLLGALRGGERYTLILGVLFVVLVLAGLVVSVTSETVWSSALVMVSGILGLAFLLWDACRRSTPSIPEGANSTVIDTQLGYAIRAPMLDPVEQFVRARELFQGRQQLPAPHGLVNDGKPERTESLRELSERERADVQEATAETIRKHDEEVISRLQQSVRALTAVGDDPGTTEDGTASILQTGSTADFRQLGK